MQKHTRNLSGKSILALVIILIGNHWVPTHTYADSMQKQQISKQPCRIEELRRRAQQAKLENWQHDREAEEYQSEIRNQRSPEFMAGKNAYRKLRSILQAHSLSPVSATSILQSQLAPPQIFYVSRKGPTDGTANGKSWKTAWPELNQIDWTTILEANNCNRHGSAYPGIAFSEPINVVIEIDGGPAGSFMTYYTPLKLPPTGNNPYRSHPLIRVANDPANLDRHGGQVILDGSKDNSCSPAIDASCSDGWFIWGSDGYGANWPNQSGQAEPGLAITNWPVGVYVSGLNYLWLDGLLISDCGVGVLAAACQDMPFIKIGGKQLNVSPGIPVSVGFDSNTALYDAGEGLHLHNCWIKDSYDMNYHANIWIANAAPGFPPDASFPYGCPSLDGGCIVSVCSPNLIGKIDGIVYSNAQGSDLYHWYLVRGSIIGPGLRNGIVSNQPGGDIFVHGTLFINPAKANIVKLLPGQENVIYMAHCASVIIPNTTNNKTNCPKQTPEFLNIVEGINDKIICTSISGGTINVKGDLVIGKIVHQSNTTGNTIIFSSNMIDDHFASNPSVLPSDITSAKLLTTDFSLTREHTPSITSDPAVYQVVLAGDSSLIPPASGAAVAGLVPGAAFGDGFALDYRSR